jgi:hypothetical protein
MDRRGFLTGAGVAAGAAALDVTSDLSTVFRREQGRVVVQRTQDTTPYLEANRRELAEAPSWNPYGSGRKDKALRKVASIPMIVVEQWMREGLNIFDPSPETQKRIAQKLNSNEYRDLRTFPGKVGYRT